QYNNGLVLNIAANYGGRWDIVHAAKCLAQQVQEGQLSSEDVDEEKFNALLCLGSLPAVDLLIRTGGETRISNFLLWQIAYAELYFTDTYWPDFDEHAFQTAINDFAERQRRYGMTGEQVS
ncbi:MAG: undecaprenyl diphosphate synthase, partial [Paraglaciecola sp.]